MKWLKDNMIYAVKHGSMAYGLNDAWSDLDLKGLVIPPKDVEYNLFHKFEQAENDVEFNQKYSAFSNPNNPKIESTIYSLKKIFTLAADVNPNCIELFYIDTSDILYIHPIMEKLLEHRDLFLSSKAKFTFSGYAHAQLHKIDRHRKWIIRGEIPLPKRADFGLKDTPTKCIDEVFGLIKSEVERWNLSQFPIDELQRSELKSTMWELIYNISKIDVNDGNWPAIYGNGVVERLAEEYNLKDSVVDVLQRERAFRRETEAYKSWINWKQNRNPSRHELEVKYGFDCKSASHLVRLMRMGWEILSEKKVLVKRPDADEIKSIRNGKWTYDQLLSYFNDMEVKLNGEYNRQKIAIANGESISLPQSVNKQKLNELYHQLYEDYWSRNNSQKLHVPYGYPYGFPVHPFKSID
jgi:predicted nucleotidyltransferase